MEFLMLSAAVYDVCGYQQSFGTEQFLKYLPSRRNTRRWFANVGLIVALRALQCGSRPQSSNKRLDIEEEYHQFGIQAKKDLYEERELHRARRSPSRCVWLHFRRSDFLRGGWLRVCLYGSYFRPDYGLLCAR